MKFKKVQVGRDFGFEAEIASGLDGDERVVSNPGDRLADGVEVALHKKTAEAAGQPGGGNPSATKPASAPPDGPAPATPPAGGKTQASAQ